MQWTNILKVLKKKKKSEAKMDFRAQKIYLPKNKVKTYLNIQNLREFGSSRPALYEMLVEGAVLRWQRNRMGRPLSPPQILRKNIWTLSKFHKTTSECWQRTPGTQKDSPLSSKGDVSSSVLYGWRSLEATVRIRLKARGRRLKSKTWEHQRTPDSREH